MNLTPKIYSKVFPKLNVTELDNLMDKFVWNITPHNLMVTLEYRKYYKEDIYIPYIEEQDHRLYIFQENVSRSGWTLDIETVVPEDMIIRAIELGKNESWDTMYPISEEILHYIFMTL